MMNLVYRFGGRQIHASEDDGSVNHALIRDIDAEMSRLEQFGAELDADWRVYSSCRQTPVIANSKNKET